MCFENPNFLQGIIPEVVQDWEKTQDKRAAEFNPFNTADPKRRFRGDLTRVGW